jgi:aryl-alcohol dehydrogenase-like predicted oxidoreductase
MVAQRIFETAAGLGKMVFVRSAYLQGLLLMPPEKVRERLPRAYNASRKWWELVRSLGASPEELAVRFVLSLHCPIVVGVETVSQLKDNLRLFRQSPMPPEEAHEIERVMKPFLNESILNPVNWSA